MARHYRFWSNAPYKCVFCGYARKNSTMFDTIRSREAVSIDGYVIHNRDDCVVMANLCIDEPYSAQKV